MAELYHLLQMFFSAILFLISCLGTLGQFLYSWAGKKEDKKVQIHENKVMVLSNHSAANKRSVEKEVMLTCEIEMTGKIKNCHLAQSNGKDVFDRRILQYEQQIRYPAGKTGIKVKEYAYKYMINFKLAQ